MHPTVVPATPHAIVRYLELRNIEAPSLHGERYEFDDVVALWLEAEKRAADPHIGFRVAELVPFGAFGTPEHLMITSTTLNAALHRLVHFYPLVNEALALSLSGSRLELFRRDGGELLSFYADFVLTSIRRRVDVALGFPSAAQHQGNALVFERDLLTRHLPAADEELCATIEEVALQRMNKSSTTDVVRDILAAHPADDLRRVARRLAMSARTLQRRLVAERTTFRAVVDEVRREAAMRLLAHGHSIKYATDFIGFDEVRSFHRAFRRWTGTTPEQWRDRSL